MIEVLDITKKPDVPDCGRVRCATRLAWHVRSLGTHHSIRPLESGDGAEGGTRTPTVLLPPAPQAGASANSATSACFSITSTSAPGQARGPVPGRCWPAAWARPDRARPASTATASDLTVASAACGRPAPNWDRAC